MHTNKEISAGLEMLRATIIHEARQTLGVQLALEMVMRN